MSMNCSICLHSSVGEIGKQLLEGRSTRSMADQWSVSKTALLRHKAHISSTLVKAQGAAEIANADALISHVRVAEGRSERLYAMAEEILKRALSGDEPAPDENSAGESASESRPRRRDTSARTALQAIKVAVDILGEARKYLELRGQITGELNGAGGVGIEGRDSRPLVTITFPVASAEQIAEMENAQVIDLPPQMRRLLHRPSDGKQR